MKPFTFIDKKDVAAAIGGALFAPLLMAGALYVNRDAFHSTERTEHAVVADELLSFASKLSNSTQRLTNLTALDSKTLYALVPCREELTSPAESYDVAKAATCVRNQAEAQKQMSTMHVDIARCAAELMVVGLLVVGIPFALMAKATSKGSQRKRPPSQLAAG